MISVLVILIHTANYFVFNVLSDGAWMVKGGEQ